MTNHQDAISLLTSDHRTVEQLFADYERGLQSADAKRQVVDQIIRELSVHAAVEEAYFYPEVRKALGEGGELVDESLHEHQEVKEALAALEDMDPADAAYDQKVAALIADVRHPWRRKRARCSPSCGAPSAPSSWPTLARSSPMARPRRLPGRAGQRPGGQGGRPGRRHGRPGPRQAGRSPRRLGRLAVG
jgi:Hemerythrin HHE cation binding domain